MPSGLSGTRKTEIHPLWERETRRSTRRSRTHGPSEQLACSPRSQRGDQGFESPTACETAPLCHAATRRRGTHADLVRLVLTSVFQTENAGSIPAVRSPPGTVPRLWYPNRQRDLIQTQASAGSTPARSTQPNTTYSQIVQPAGHLALNQETEVRILVWEHALVAQLAGGNGLRDRPVRVRIALRVRCAVGPGHPGTDGHADVAQQVRAPPCHGGGRGFESRRWRAVESWPSGKAAACQVVLGGNPSGPRVNDRRRRSPGSALRRDEVKHARSVEEIRDGTDRKPRTGAHTINNKSPISPNR